eukprot:scaffold4873_cov208-Pinguiococcus_pyrenoidosus.AAC.5
MTRRLEWRGYAEQERREPGGLRQDHRWRVAKPEGPQERPSQESACAGPCFRRETLCAGAAQRGGWPKEEDTSVVCVPQTLITGLCATLVCARSSTDVWRACSQTVREAFQAEGPGEGAAEEEVDLRRGDAREVRGRSGRAAPTAPPVPLTIVSCLATQDTKVLVLDVQPDSKSFNLLEHAGEDVFKLLRGHARAASDESSEQQRSIRLGLF